MSEIYPDHGIFSKLQCRTDPKCYDFSVKVDWDVDILFDERCGGSDWFFPDDPITINIRFFDDGNIYVDSKYDDGRFDYHLMPDGRLLKRKYNLWVATAEAPRAMVTRSWGTDTIPINRDFYECYLSGDRELSLNEAGVVERFFKAVEFSFYRDYECTSVNEDNRYPFGCE